MGVQRLQIAKNKKSVASKHEKRDVAGLLGKGKEELARIKAEHIIREDFTIEAYEVLELLCELLHERIRLITNSDSKNPPSDLTEAMASIIWATNRVTIEELNEVKNQIRKKYGSQFVQDAENNVGNIVNKRLVHKLSTDPPSHTLVVSYLVEIAKEFKIDWEPTEAGVPEGEQAFMTPSGFSIPMAPGSELRSVYQRQTATSSDTPVAPTAFIPNPRDNRNDRDNGGGGLPSPPVNPVLPSPPSLPLYPRGTASATAPAAAGNYGPGIEFDKKFPNDSVSNSPGQLGAPSVSADYYDGNYHGDIPMVTAVVIDPVNPNIPPMGDANAVDSSGADSTDESFSALQARLAALRQL